MVTSFEPSARLVQPASTKSTDGDKHTPAFPLSSPPSEHLTKFRPSNSEAVFSSGNPFLSTNKFASSSSDDETGSSSGCDEFQLERYSRLFTNASHPTLQRGQRRQSIREKTKKRNRPGLNIVTNFATLTHRTHTDGIAIDRVHAQKPRIRSRYATSVASAKAEHGYNSLEWNSRGVDAYPIQNAHGVTGTSGSPKRLDKSKRALGREALTRLQELQAARKKASTTPGHLKHQLTTTEDLQVPVAQSEAKQHSRTSSSPAERSIVIGLSIPEHEAEAHKFGSGGDSALSLYTPDTPAIIVTPADERDKGLPIAIISNQRLSSSTWSTTTSSEKLTSHEELPPMPKFQAGHSSQEKLINDALGTAGSHDTGHDEEKYQNRAIGGGYHQQASSTARRASSESKEFILGDHIQSARHKSQGWWNLMLSPMLSRKGTLKSLNAEDNNTPPLPSIPNLVQVPKDMAISPVSSQSPGTPRRFGLASARASVWSRWTTWEKDRDRTMHPKDETHLSPTASEQGLKVDAPKELPLFNPAAISGKGLAAEYFHACAVEQVKEIRYFECENHSCAEQLPKYRSIFDPIQPVAAPIDVKEQAQTMAGPQAATALVSANAGRVLSGISIRTEPDELSPNVRQADTAEVVQARSIDSLERATDTQKTINKKAIERTPFNPPAEASKQPIQLDRAFSRHQTDYPSIATVIPTRQVSPAIPSPGPVSPGMQQNMASRGAVPMADIDPPRVKIRSSDQTQTADQQAFRGQTPTPSYIIQNHATQMEKSVISEAPISQAASAMKESPNSLPTANPPVTVSRGSLKEEAPAKGRAEDKAEKSSLLSKVKCLGRKRAPAGNEVSTPKRKRRVWIITIVMLLIVVACVLLATLLTRSGDGPPVQSQWLNLTGYPPIPTGISTIARPDVQQQSQCVAPSTLWSCALPKENQAEIVPNAPDQPNFRFQISFQNGSVPANMTLPIEMLSKRSSALHARIDNPFSIDLFEPDPAPPSRADQIFMGNTTDNITQPFDGEKTPFFITFVPVFPVDPANLSEPTATNPSRRRKRQTGSSTDSIPAPEILSDGSAAPANLLPTAPYPSSQPLRLYNRGLPDEHYGFYMYYDKAIFLRTDVLFNASSRADDDDGIDPADENGGATRDEARIRCTFSQTRFLVRMWTNPAFGATLLPPLTDTNTTSEQVNVNSATDFSRPGSFPYPTTITLDRHGGNVNKKAAYCYGVDGLQVIQANIKTLIPELRGLNGQLINPAPRLINGTGLDDGFNQNAGGIDGGTGGCGCTWQNWN